MTTLEGNTLAFHFPETAARVRERIEEHFAKLVGAIAVPGDWHTPFDSLARCFRQSYDPRSRDPAFVRGEFADWVRSISDQDVQSALGKLCQQELFWFGDDSIKLRVSFQRTMRIPDDGRTYPLPAGFGEFPLRPVDDFPDALPDLWNKRGGVMMPMYQSEALWIRFTSRVPFALKVAAGKIDAVSGKAWADGLCRGPQNYVVVPGQPWLDGFAAGKGVVRQFVAMPLGAGYSVEEQITGNAEFGGIQLQAFPMRPDVYFEQEVAPELPTSMEDILESLLRNRWGRVQYSDRLHSLPLSTTLSEPMSLAAGGTIRQEIHADPYPFEVWDQDETSRCFVHLANSMTWRQITGENPPHPPITAAEYVEAGIPWFDHYRDDLEPLEGSEQFVKVKSVKELGAEKGEQPLPENTSITPQKIVQYGNARRPREIREFLENP